GRAEGASDPAGEPPPAVEYTTGEVYHYELVRTADGWRFSRIQTTPVWRSGTPFRPGHRLGWGDRLAPGRERAGLARPRPAPGAGSALPRFRADGAAALSPLGARARMGGRAPRHRLIPHP